MPTERPVKVFPEIPHYPPEEIDTRVMPTASTTTLCTPLEKHVMGNHDLLRRVENLGVVIPQGEALPSSVEALQVSIRSVSAQNSEERKRATRDLLQVGGREYPHIYGMVRGILSQQLESPNQVTRRRAQEFLTALDEEYKPSEYTQVRMRFEQHGIKDPSQFMDVTATLKEEIGQIFKKGEANFYLRENVSGVHGKFDEAFRKELARTGSFRRADIYAQASHFGKGEPDPGILQRAWEEYPTFLMSNGDPQPLYYWAVYTALDRFTAKGYTIGWIPEQSSPKYDMDKIIKDSLAREGGLTLGFYMNFMRRSMADANSRNQIMAQQLSNIEKQAERKKERTNIFVLLGTNHYKLGERLPQRMQGVISTSKYEKPGQTEAEKTIIDMLASGENPPDKLWEAFGYEIRGDDLSYLLK